MNSGLADSWQIVSAGTFALDGGAMFGVVPRALWQSLMPPDSRGRVRLGLNTLLVRSGEQVILVDTGLGDAAEDAFQDRHAPSLAKGVLSALEREGVEPESVTDVVNTHLHWDHAGGNMVRAADGNWRPAFPAAQYHVQRGEWQFACQAPARCRGSYRKVDFEPLLAAGQLSLLDGEVTIAPGVRVHPAPGHLPHMQVVTIRTAQGTVWFPADLVPTRHHLGPAWGMAYDVEPLVVSQVKGKWLQQAAEENWCVILYHEPEAPVGHVARIDGRLQWQGAEGE